MAYGWKALRDFKYLSLAYASLKVQVFTLKAKLIPPSKRQPLKGKQKYQSDLVN